MTDHTFIAALEQNKNEAIEKIPKSDIHSHAGRGGHIKYISSWANLQIAPPSVPFESLGHMQEWYVTNVKKHCPGLEGYLKR